MSAGVFVAACRICRAPRRVSRRGFLLIVGVLFVQFLVAAATLDIQEPALRWLFSIGLLVGSAVLARLVVGSGWGRSLLTTVVYIVISTGLSLIVAVALK